MRPTPEKPRGPGDRVGPAPNAPREAAGHGGRTAGVVRRLFALLFSLAVAPTAAARQDAPRCDHDPRRPPFGFGQPADPRAPDPLARGPARESAPCGQATVSPERRVHILDGDARGGGHRPGRGIPSKSEFPRGWSDDRIIGVIEDVANDPASARRAEPDGRTVVTGHRHGVDVRVVIDRDGRSIVTGYPTNTARNPR
jgi:hypothetical protein